MSGDELRKKFLTFFEERGHAVVPSSSLLPDDPSVLLTTAGMQQFKKYFTGEVDPLVDLGGKRATSIQKAFRTSDIDEVGDESHLTFFEMLGHFSFGDYSKEDTIKWTFEFLTSKLNIPPERISATIFEGDDEIPFDDESYNVWVKLISPEKIRKGGREDNVWGPAGAEGPCGAANEVYVDGLEVATLVFLNYYCAKDGTLTPLKNMGVDVGWGFERLAKIVQNAKTIFDIDSIKPFFELLPKELSIKIKRIIIDHLRASAFLISDGVRPSNKEAGYILRRLLRRVLTYEHQNKMPNHILDGVLHDIVHEYGVFYPELLKAGEEIRIVIREESEKFLKTLQVGMKAMSSLEEIDAKSAFKLFESYGLPYEIIKEMGDKRAVSLTRELFDEEFKKHQEISRAGQTKKFGGHGLLLDTGELKAADEEELEKVTRLHTATHLLHASLRMVLGETVSQAGSDITVERTRFDFAFDRKLTNDEVVQVEHKVNFAIKQNYIVEMKEMPYEEALKLGALHFFKEKYPEIVKVYSIGNFKADPPEIFSRELCGGPHVKETGTIGVFKITKQEAVGSGVRRIRATVE
jgi:alanyl-tRNA synthetase